MNEWPHNSSFYVPLREAMKDADYLPTDSGEGIERQSPRDGFRSKAEERKYLDELSSMDERLITY